MIVPDLHQVTPCSRGIHLVPSLFWGKICVVYPGDVVASKLGPVSVSITRRVRVHASGDEAPHGEPAAYSRRGVTIFLQIRRPVNRSTNTQRLVKYLALLFHLLAYLTNILITVGDEDIAVRIFVHEVMVDAARIINDLLNLSIGQNTSLVGASTQSYI